MPPVKKTEATETAAPEAKQEPNAETKPKSVFEVLSTVDCSAHVEMKDTGKTKLAYLSWAWAWAELKKRYPCSFYTVYHNKDDWNYFTDGKTCWVKTGVTVIDSATNYALEYIEELPVMDYRNASVPLEQITSMQVNKAIQRSLTKAVARHGLGLYIYAGEDLPEEDEDTKKQKADTAALLSQVDRKIKALIHSMSPDEKKKFAAEKVEPVLGMTNYLKCTDPVKLQTLLSSLE